MTLAANIWKFKAVTQKREIEAVDLLTADKIRAALTARQLDATGLKAVVAARLKEAILADGQQKNSSNGDGGAANRSDRNRGGGTPAQLEEANTTIALGSSNTESAGTRLISTSSRSDENAIAAPSPTEAFGKLAATDGGGEEERPHSATNALMTGRDFDGLFAGGSVESRPTSATSALVDPPNAALAARAPGAAATGRAPRSQQPLPPRRLRQPSSKMTSPSSSSIGGGGGSGPLGSSRSITGSQNAAGAVSHLPSPPPSRGSRRASAAGRTRASHENNDEGRDGTLNESSPAAAAAAAAAPTTFTTQGLPTFEALVCFRSYEGFSASLEGFGGQMLLKRDPKDGTDYYAPLTVRLVFRVFEQGGYLYLRRRFLLSPSVYLVPPQFRMPMMMRRNHTTGRSGLLVLLQCGRLSSAGGSREAGDQSSGAQESRSRACNFEALGRHASIRSGKFFSLDGLLFPVSSLTIKYEDVLILNGFLLLEALLIKT